MNIVTEIPEYDGDSLDVLWDEGGEYELFIEDECIVLSANKIAMISLAKQLLYFANNSLPNGSHIHFNSFFCKDIKGTYELIIEERR